MYDEEPKPRSLWWLWLLIGISCIASIFIFRLFYSNQNAGVAVDSTRFVTEEPANSDSNETVALLKYEEITDSGIIVRGNADYTTFVLFLFEPGKISLSADAPEKLRQIARSVTRRFFKRHLEIYSYADSTGSTEANIQLTKARAEAVRRWLIYEGGLAASRISIYAAGESDPIAPNDTPNGRRLNRRIEIVAINGDVTTAPSAVVTR